MQDGRLIDSQDKTEARHYRTLFLSDIHLGTRGCQADALLEFLRWHDADTIYLVGDIVDGWRLRKGWYWPDAHNEVVRRVLKMAHRGTRIVFIADKVTLGDERHVRSGRGNGRPCGAGLCAECEGCDGC